MQLPAFFSTARLLLSIVLLVFGCELRAQLTYNELTVQYDSPWTYKKLQLIPVRFKGPGGGAGSQKNIAFDNGVISFSDALRRNKISIKETSSGGGPDVATLVVKSRSKENILLGYFEYEYD